MQLLALTFFLILFSVAIMSIGVIMGRKPITGSCGGSSLGINNSCDICKNDVDACDKKY